MRFFFLALLARGPAHGYALKQMHDQLFGPPWPPMNIGQIYVTMGRLERDALVETHFEADRKIYTLTELGTKTLNNWLSEPDPAMVSKSDFLLRLVSASIVTSEALATVIAENRHSLIAELRVLDDSLVTHRQGPQQANPLAELLVQQASLHLQADLKWLDLAEQYLRKSSRSHPKTEPGSK
jgi:DNA-binding PadR family transcriptional regulator